MAGAGSALKSKRELGKATRDAFGRALEALGADYPDLVVVDADVGNSTRTEWFGQKYPGRFFNIGISESNLVGIAGGLAAAGKTSLISSFAAFVTCNAYDQLRMSVAYPHLNVKVVGSHAGISIGEDGASQMGIEDVALACALPGFVVLVPADEPSAKAATKAMLDHKGPVYLRTGRADVPKVYTDGPAPFTIGKANQLRQGSDVTLVANGLMVAPASTPPRPSPPPACRPGCSTCTRSSRSTPTPSKPPQPRPARWWSPRSTSPTEAWAAWWPWPSPGCNRSRSVSSTSATSSARAVRPTRCSRNTA